LISAAALNAIAPLPMPDFFSRIFQESVSSALA
jgi:hypothetical protein